MQDRHHSPESESHANSMPESARRRTSSDVTDDEQQIQDMLAEGGGVLEPNVPLPGEDEILEPKTRVERIQRKLVGWLEDFSEKWGAEHLKTLVQKKGRLSTSMGSIPKNMHRVANQTRLVLELVDDFRDGTYREISWRSVALLVGGLLYSVNPADVIPNVIPVIGQLDDLAILAVVTRIVQGDLRKYCQFKGYDESEYFGTQRKSSFG